MSLKKWRLVNGLKGYEAAKLFGVDPSSYSRFERKEQSPRTSTARRIVELTGGLVTLDELYLSDNTESAETDVASEGGSADRRGGGASPKTIAAASGGVG